MPAQPCWKQGSGSALSDNVSVLSGTVLLQPDSWRTKNCSIRLLLLLLLLDEFSPSLSTS